MSEHLWFYADSNKQQQGPITFGEIQQLAAKATIQPSTLIWKQGMESWTAASKIEGVFSNPETQTAGPPTPIPVIPSNPYEAPYSGNSTTVSAAGSYPIPYVKKCSFALLLSLFITGAIIGAIGLGIFITDLAEVSGDYETSTNQPEQLSPESWPKDRMNDGTQNFTPPQQTTATKTPSLVGVGVMAIAWVPLVIANILTYIFLYRAWHILQPGGARTSPGKAVGFLFIPLFNFYWIFICYHGWAQDWNRIRNSHSNLTSIPTVSEGLFLAGPIFLLAAVVPFIGLLPLLAGVIIMLIMFFNICTVINAMADASQQPN